MVYIIILIIILTISIILYARDTPSYKKANETPSLKILPPRTGGDSSERIPEIQNFFGRREELLKIGDLLKEEDCIAIYGEPGVGKTAIASQLTKGLQKDKVFWFTCDERSSLESLLSRLNGSLKENNDRYFEPVLRDYRIGIDEKLRLLAKRLALKNLFIFIDQVERIKDERLRMALRYLGENLKGSKLVIITSSKIETHNLIRIEPFKAEEIRSNPFSLDSEVLEAIDERGGILPLELGLLNGLLNYYHLKPEDIITRIKGGLKELLNETLQRLRDDERILLRQIALATEPLPEEGIRYLVRRIDLRDILSCLVASGILTREGEYYSLHSHIKELLFPQVVNSKESYKALAHYYLDLFRLRPFIGLILEASYYSIMAREFDLVFSTLLLNSKRIIDNGYGLNLLKHLASYKKEDVSIRDWIQITGLKGNIYKAIGSLDEAKEEYEEMLKSARVINSRQGMSLAYNNLGSIYQARAEWNLAISHYELGLEVLKEMEYVRRKTSLQDVGWVYRGKGRWNDAIRYYLSYYEKGLKTSRDKGDLVGQANSYANLGLAYKAQGEWNLAIDYYNRCLEILHRLDDPIAEARCYDDLGSIYSAKGDLDRAITYYEKGLEIFERLDELDQNSRSLFGLAEVYYQKKDYQRSISYYERGLEKLREMGDIYKEASYLIRLAKVLKEEQDLKYSERCLLRAKEIFEQLDEDIKDASFYETAAYIYEAKGDTSKAIDCLKDGLEILTNEGDLEDGSLYKDLCALLLSAGRFEEASTYLYKALEIAEAIGDKESQIQNLRQLASLFKRMGDDKKAVLYHKKADSLESRGD